MKFEKLFYNKQTNSTVLLSFFTEVAEMYFTKLLAMILGVISSIATARLLGPEGRGVLTLAVTITALGSQIGNLGLQASITNKISQNKSLLLSFLGNSFLVSFGFCGGCIYIYWNLVHLYPDLSPIHGTPLLLALLCIPLSVMYLYLSNMLLAINRIRPINFLEIINRILGLIFIFLLIVFGITSVNYILVFSTAISAIFILLSLFIIKDYLIDFPKPSLSFFRLHFSYGFRIYIATLFMYILLKIDIFMVNAYMGEEQVGYYSLAVGLIDMMYILPMVTGTIIFPKLSAIEKKIHRWQMTLKTIQCLSFIMLFYCVTAGYSAHILIEFLYGANFLPSVTPFIYLLPALFALSINTILMSFLASQGAPNITYISPAIAAFLNISLNVILIPKYGLTGAAVSSTISYIIMLLIVLLYCNFSIKAIEK